jgi:hypothetical protein
VRAAVGASRARLVRQLLSESLVLAALGGALGVLVAVGATRALTGVGSDLLPVPIVFDLQPDGTVLAFAALVSLATTVLFGLLPAWTSSSLALVPSLKADATGEGPLRRRVTLRDGLVVAQLALSLVLLVAGALLTRGLLHARGMELGFDPTPLSSLSFDLQMNGYDEARALAFRKRVIAELQAHPGVSAAALASRLPLAPDVNMEASTSEATTSRRTSRPRSTRSEWAPTTSRPWACRSWKAARSRRTRSSAQAKVVVVNEAFATKYWPGQSAPRAALYARVSTTSRTSWSASPATTRCARWASRARPTCISPPRGRPG